MSVRLKTEKDIEGLRESGRILRGLLDELAGRVRKDVSLRDLDRRAREFLRERGAKAAFLGYRPEENSDPYPGAICTSLNEEIVHGLPRKRKLQKGDLLSIDAGVDFRGYITDSAVTVYVGRRAPREIRKLMDATREALEEGIRMCKPGNRLGDIGHAVAEVARKRRMRIVRGLTGHGVGFELHEDPTVYNFGNPGEGMELVPGLVLAIEPMLSLGSPNIVESPDGSFSTGDGSLSAHFEETVAVTEKGCKVLTR